MKSIYDNTFEHHGIKGQKWGVQNGPPYPLQENSGSSGRHRLFGKKAKTVEEKMKSHTIGEEDLKKMTNQELDDYINRLFKEKKLVSLQDETKEALKNSAAKNASKIGNLALKAGGTVLKLAWDGTVWTIQTLGKKAIEGAAIALKESIVENARENRDYKYDKKDNKKDKNRDNKKDKNHNNDKKKGNNSVSKEDRETLANVFRRTFKGIDEKTVNTYVNTYLEAGNYDMKRTSERLLDDLNKLKNP